MRVKATTVVVVLTVLLAGCSGVPGIGNNTTPTDTESKTGTELEPLPDGIGNLTADTVVTHQERIAEAGSYTTETTFSIETVNTTNTSDSTARSLTQTFKVNQYTNQSLLVADGERGLQSVYTNQTATYVQAKPARDVDDADAEYAERPPRPVDAAAATGAKSMIIDDNISYTRVGTEMHDGVEVVRFEADENASREALEEMFAANPGTENVTVTAFSSTVLVGTDGVIRQYALSYTAVNNGQRVTTSVTINVSDVAATTVDEPDWLQYAPDESTNQ